MTMEMPNYYELLEVEHDASSESIKEAYLLQSAKYNPTNLETGNPYKYHLVREAFENLGRETSRERYDRLLNESRRLNREPGS